MTELSWTQLPAEELIGKRVVFVGDGLEGYYAEIPSDMSEDDAIEAFIDTYDFNPDGGQEVWEESLRAHITSALYERFNGSRGELEDGETLADADEHAGQWE